MGARGKAREERAQKAKDTTHLLATRASPSKSRSTARGDSPSPQGLSPSVRAADTYSEQVAAAFNKMDTNRDGMMDNEEFNSHASSIGVYSKKEKQDAFTYFDQNGDGKVSFAEFAGVSEEWTSATKRLADRL